VNDQQNTLNITERVKALFALDHTVFTDDYVRVAEDSSRLVKANAVLRDIRAILALVPLEAHRHYISRGIYSIATLFKKEQPKRVAVRKRRRAEARIASDSLAQEAPSRTIAEAEIIRLSAEDQSRIAEAILNPPDPTPAMRQALRRRRELFGAE
jgi:hypothetical protein